MNERDEVRKKGTKERWKIYVESKEG